MRAARSWNFIAMALVMAFSALVARADDPAPPAAQVFRFVGTQRGSYMGKPVLMLQLAPPTGGQPSQVAIPNEPPGGPYAPNPGDMTVISAAKPGDLLNIKATRSPAGMLLTEVTTYDAKPGEDTPNAFIFSSSKSENGVLSVDLLKFGQKGTVTIPSKKDDAGTLVPTDAAIAAALPAFKEGDVVVAVVRPGRPSPTLSSIELYVVPTDGTFVDLTSSVVDGQKQPAIDVKSGDNTTTLLIPGSAKSGKWVPDPKLMAAVMKIKANQAIQYRITQDADKTFLKDIVVVPPAKPAPKKAE